MAEPLIYCEFCLRLIRPKETYRPGYDIVNRKICCFDCLRDRFPGLFVSRMEERRRLRGATGMSPPALEDTEAITVEVPAAGAAMAVSGNAARLDFDRSAECAGAGGEVRSPGAIWGDISSGKTADAAQAAAGPPPVSILGIAACLLRSRAAVSISLGAAIGISAAIVALFLSSVWKAGSQRPGDETSPPFGRNPSGGAGGGLRSAGVETRPGGKTMSPPASAFGEASVEDRLHPSAEETAREGGGAKLAAAVGQGIRGEDAAKRGGEEPIPPAATIAGIIAENAGDVTSLPAAIARLGEYLAAEPNGPMAAAAARKIIELKAEQDARTRTLWRDAAERASALAAEGRINEALAAVEELKKNPGEGEWLAKEGAAKMAILEAEIKAAGARAAEEPAGGTGAASHREAIPSSSPAAGTSGNGIVSRLEDSATGAAGSRRLKMEFYDGFDRCVAKLDLDAAAELARRLDPAAAGMTEAEARAFEEDARSVRSVYEELAAALRARKGSEVTVYAANAPITGVIASCEGDDLVLSRDRAVFSVRLSKMKVSELRGLLGHKRRARAMYVLGAARGEIAETEEALGAAAAEAGDAPWPHLASRLKFRKEQEFLRGLPARIASIELLVKDGGFEKAAAELAAVAASLLDVPQDALPDTMRAQIAELDKKLRKIERSKIVLQNGVSPEGFDGIKTDQISARREDLDIADRGSAWGLKIGSFDDLKRVLIGFEGLEKIIGKDTRVRRATLDLYQTDNSAAEGAVAGLFRLKRRWAPDSGTWLYCDRSEKIRWQIPGASGATDASREPESVVTFDDKRDVWRSWDVTSYVRDVIEGRAPNNGLLLRIVADEPKYHIRFYPEKDLLTRPDPKLRPRLLLEVEKIADRP